MTSTHSFMAIKLTGFQKNNHEGDYTCISSIHYETSNMGPHAISHKKISGWSLNFWASSGTLTLIITL